MLSRRPFTSTILHGEYISVSTTLEAEVSRQVSILSQKLSPQLIFESPEPSHLGQSTNFSPTTSDTFDRRPSVRIDKRS